jgi:hypothetical protein
MEYNKANAPMHPAIMATKTLKESRQMPILIFNPGIHRNSPMLPSVMEGMSAKVKPAVINPRVMAYAVLALELIFSKR